ncbi:MAG: hypothetical protein AAGM67_07975 [Bacteroidota bacterium]
MYHLLFTLLSFFWQILGTLSLSLVDLGLWGQEMLHQFLLA